MQPSLQTNGRILSEDEVRAYMRCSKRWALGDHLINDTPEYLLLKLALRAWSLDHMEESLSYYVLKTAQQINSNKKDSLINDLVIKATALETHFKSLGLLVLENYQIKRVKVSKSCIGLEYFAIHGKRNGHYYILNLSPYTHRYMLENDPLLHLKAYLISRETNTPTSIYTYCTRDIVSRIDYQNGVACQALPFIQATIDSMQKGLNSPLAACIHNCPFKFKTCSYEASNVQSFVL